MFKDEDFQFTINVFFQDELFEEVDEKYFSPAARFHNLHHLKDGHCQTASINEILQQKHINFLATSEPYYNIINIDEPSLQRCTLFNHVTSNLCPE